MSNSVFFDKLIIIRNIIFSNKPLELSNAYEAAEKKLGFQLPQFLKDFYLIFGEELGILKCMYDIAAPMEMSVDDGILLIAKENQNVCGYGIDIQSQKVIYIDESNGVKNDIDKALDDFLLYLLALQCTDFFPSVGILEAEYAITLEKFMKRITLSKEDGAVYYIIDKSIGVRVGNEIYICMHNDNDLEEFENISGLLLEWP